MVLVNGETGEEALAPEIQAGHVRDSVHGLLNRNQHAFPDFVPSHCISVGVECLDTAKPAPLLGLKYRDSIPEGISELRRVSLMFSTELRKFSYILAA